MGGAGVSINGSFVDARVIIPAVVTLFVLLVSNLVILWRIRLDARSALKREMTLQKISKLKEQLEKFYDPLLALNKLNEAMFSSMGRETFPENPHLKQDAELVWNEVIKEIIVPTNRKICQIIKEYSHLIDAADDFETYMAFIRHAESYEIFTRQRNEIHKKFLYPKGFNEQLRLAREKVMRGLQEAERNIGSYLSRKRS
jgi:hypothetical protein